MDNFQVLVVEFRPIKLSRKQRTTFETGICDDCGYTIAARSLEAVIAAGLDHAEWHRAVDEALN